MIHAESDFYLPSVQKKTGNNLESMSCQKGVGALQSYTVLYKTIGCAQTCYRVLQTKEKSRGNTLLWESSYSSLC